MLSFIAALYNEEKEIMDFINHIVHYVDNVYLCDDGSTDKTRDIILKETEYHDKLSLITIPHTGLPETVKNEALSHVPEGSWVLMLDADERFAPGVLEAIRLWLRLRPDDEISPRLPEPITHVYFQQFEIIDNIHVRTFQKSKLFKKEAIRFSTGIHEDDQFEGRGIYKPEWIVYHRKSSDKQKQRELEYLETYDRLFEEGKIDEGRRQWLRGLHHFHTS